MRQRAGESTGQTRAEAEHAAPSQHIVEPNSRALHQRSGAVVERHRCLGLVDASRLQVILQIASDAGERLQNFDTGRPK